MKEKIQFIARKSAASNLQLRDASDLFTALYCADALFIAGGDCSLAADILGIDKSYFRRRCKARTKRTVIENEE